jgi:pimeloyl-ACP methyl ester carboxylesterase
VKSFVSRCLGVLFPIAFLPSFLWASLPDNYLELGLPADQVSFLVQGNERGAETVVFLHGAGSRKETWNSVVRAMGPIGKSKRLVSIDTRGHGGTPLAGIDQRPWLHAVDLRNWMDAHGVNKAHLVGHSLGGRVTLAFAALFPDRVRSIVVVDIAPFKSRRDEADAEKIRAGNLTLELSDNLIVQSWGEDLTGALASARFPVLFMGGDTERGAILTPKHIDRLSKLNPTLRFSHFHGAGHGLYKDQPERFVSELEAFWKPSHWLVRCLRAILKKK